MASVGPKYPTTAQSTATGEANEVTWQNPINVADSDTDEATIVAATFDSPDPSYWLECAGFDFSAIPAGSTIDGILVEVNRRSIIASSGIDRKLRILDANGSPIGDDKKDAVTVWPSSLTVKSYGGATDTWNTGLSPENLLAMVKDPQFGVALQAQANIQNADIGVAWMRVTVYYTEAGPQEYTKTFPDTIGGTDAIAKTIHPATIPDTIAGTDASSRRLTKIVADAIQGTDSIRLPSGVLARRFVATNSGRVSVDIGSASLTGAFSIMALVRFPVGGSAAVILQNAKSNGFNSIYLGIDLNDKLQVNVEGGSRTGTYTIPRGEWVLVGVTKAAGTTTPRGHIWDGSWHHEDLPGGDIGNPAGQAGGNINFFCWPQFNQFYDGDLAVAAEWAVDLCAVLGDSLVEGLLADPESQNFEDLNPIAGWNFNQASVATPVTDWTGGGADQSSITGTEVNGDGPADWDYSIQQDYTKLIEDSIQAADSITPVKSTAVTIEDTISATDSIASTFAKAVMDTIAGTDSQAKAVTALQADALSIADNITALRGLTAAVQDSIAVTDDSHRAVTIALTDALAIADELFGVEQNAFGVSEDLAVTDAIAIAVTKPIGDAAALSDTVDPQLTEGGQQLTQDVDDSIGATDAVSFAAGVHLDDTAALSDAIVKSATSSVSDSIVITDEFAEVWAATVEITENLLISDTIQKQSTGSHSLEFNEQLGITDEATPKTDYTRQVDDSVGAADAASKQPGVHLADLLAGADALGRAWAALLTIEDTGTLTDAQYTASTGAWVLNLNDAISAADSPSTAAGYHRTQDDAMAVADAIAQTVGLRLQIADTAVFTDEARHQANFGREVGDLIVARDTIRTRRVEPGIPELVRIRREIESAPEIPEAEWEAIRREIEEKDW